MARTKSGRAFTLDNDLIDWLDTFPAKKASATVNRALKALKESLDGLELVLIRGLPGSGKSTMAREQFPDHILIEADQYFMRGDRYVFKKEDLPRAHSWCQAAVASALADNMSVVVANTFTTREEMEPYHTISRMIGCDIRIIVAPHNDNPFPSVHNVPPETVDAMRERWEE